MAVTIPKSIPTLIRAGQTLQFQLSFGDYPAGDGWVLHFTGRCKDGGFAFQSTADGNDHLVTVTAATTADWPPGDYYLEGEAVLAAQTFGVYTGWLTVAADISATAEGTDTRTQNRKTLDAINATLEGRASRDVLKSSIEGTVIERIPIDQLLMLKDRYDAIVAREEMEDKVQAGKASGKVSYIRFLPR